MKQIMASMGVTAFIVIAAACSGSDTPRDTLSFPAAEVISKAGNQIRLQIAAIEADTTDAVLNPVTTHRNRYATAYCRWADWRSGFFPGTLWYLYELSGDSSLIDYACRYTEAIAPAQFLRTHHDVGFMINCSYGNARRVLRTDSYDSVMVNAANSLCSRFRPEAGIIQSWDVNDGSWQSKRGWKCPVIIDNMMNLELLFEVTELTGDSSYYNIAVTHADTTLKEHFRPDGSCYHVVDYDPATGDVLHRETAQGYADESAWSRGQAWAIYGYTMCYRYTGDKRYLDRAMATFDYMRDNASMPADHIPYWDMNAPYIPDEPRDASSAAIIASALYEMSTLPVSDPQALRDYADSILMSLASDDYTAAIGRNGRFILMHSTGSLPHNAEIDVPLNYADYYYLEAIKRKLDLEKQ